MSRKFNESLQASLRIAVEALRTNLDGLRNIFKEMDAPQKNPGDFVDMTLLDEIEREGFMQRLR